jgi:hypothetical protein
VKGHPLEAFAGLAIAAGVIVGLLWAIGAADRWRRRRDQ